MTQENRGAVAGRFVAHEILARDPPERKAELLFRARSQAEADFLTATGSKALPVEIESDCSSSL